MCHKDGNYNGLDKREQVACKGRSCINRKLIYQNKNGVKQLTSSRRSNDYLLLQNVDLSRVMMTMIDYNNYLVFASVQKTKFIF